MSEPERPAGQRPATRGEEMNEAQARYEAEVRAGVAPPPSAAVPRRQAVAQAQARKALSGGGVSLKFTPAVPLAGKLGLATSLLALAAVIAFFAVAAHDAIWRDRPWLSFGAPGSPGPGPSRPEPPPDMSFTLMLSSQPSGAEVYVNGQGRGKTPAMVNVSCKGGEEIGLRVERSGYKPWETRVPCQRGGTARPSIVLERP